MKAESKFPNAAWDGMSASRADAPHVTRGPDNVDWDQIIAEITATQEYILSLGNTPTGDIGTSQLGSGTANSTTFLRGDSTWAVPSIAFSALTGSASASQLGSGSASSSTFLRGDGSWQLTSTIISALDASHLNSGTVAPARLGSGTTDSTTFLRGDGTWTTPPSGGTDASALTSGTVATARLGSGSASSTTYLRGDGTWVDPISALPAANITGTIGHTSLGTGTANSSTFLRGDATWATVTVAASDVSGTLTPSQLGSGSPSSANFLRGDGTWSVVDLTALNASNLTSGSVPTIRLGSGTADSSHFLRGDSTWSTVDGASITGSINGARLGSGTADSTTYLRGDSTYQTLTSIPYDATISGLSSTTLKTAVDELSNHLALVNNQGTRLVSGGGIVWVSGYTFKISAATYYIAGILYSSSEQSLTLSSADATNNRFDVLALDSTGTFVKITGTAAALPSVPLVDPQSQLAITTVSVDANSSTPSTISNIVIYNENSEWTGSTSGSGIVLNSTNSPFVGTVCIEGTTVAASSYIQLQNASSIDVSTNSFLVLYVKPKSAWLKKSLVLGFYLNGVLKGSTVALADNVFGFSSSNATYQQVAIPLGSFSIPTGTLTNQLRLTISGSGASIGFFLDDIFLQTNSNNVVVSGITQAQADARYSPLAGSTSLSTVGTITSGTWNGTALTSTYIPNLDSSKITTGTVTVARLPVFVASGGSHAAGIVPDPGSSSGTTKFLREDASWTTVIVPQQSFTFGTNGTPVAGAVNLKRYVKYACSLVDIQCAVDSAPSGGAFAADIEYSADGSTGWTAVTTSGNRLSLSSGTGVGSASTFSTSTLAAGLYLRINYISVNGATNPVITLTTTRTS